MDSAAQEIQNLIVRKIAKMMVEGKAQAVHITSANVKDYMPK